jgi:hypothetical protein
MDFEIAGKHRIFTRRLSCESPLHSPSPSHKPRAILISHQPVLFSLSAGSGVW